MFEFQCYGGPYEYVEDISGLDPEHDVMEQYLMDCSGARGGFRKLSFNSIMHDIDREYFRWRWACMDGTTGFEPSDKPPFTGECCIHLPYTMICTPVRRKCVCSALYNAVAIGTEMCVPDYLHTRVVRMHGVALV